MTIELPILNQKIVNEKLEETETLVNFVIDTSVYSEERWEKNFPSLASHEGLFQYISRVQENSVSQRVTVACMLKAIFCFLESDEIKDYKQFAQMFNLAAPEYTSRLINKLKSAFELILKSSSVKN